MPVDLLRMILGHDHSSLLLVGHVGGGRLHSKEHDAPLKSPVRPSENSVKAKFAEHSFHALRWSAIRRTLW